MRRGYLLDLEGGMPIILIWRETFRLPGTQIGLALFEADAGTASDLLPRSGQLPESSGVENNAAFYKSCFVRSTEWQT